MSNGKHGKVVGVKVFSKSTGHELKAGVLMQIQVFVAQMRKIAVGDKLGGRHGNKGVIAKILPVEDMPFTEDGTPIDVILNPTWCCIANEYRAALRNPLGISCKSTRN
jgi:DNA-directed RNA polymerase subunit beta